MPIGTLGVPRIGQRRDLKHALEAFWSGKSSLDDLEATAARLRAENWRQQQHAGVDHIPSNDFSLYDHVLDTSVLVGAIPDRYGWTGGPVTAETYFALARGVPGTGLAAQEMTKWFDTNYHFIVPELGKDQQFQLASTKPVAEFLEAQALGIHTRPVLLGPVTFLRLAKSPDAGFDPWALLDRLVPVYADLLARLHAVGADWVQMDEPCLALDLDDATRAALHHAYAALTDAEPKLKLLVTSYFGPMADNLTTALTLPVAGLHFDLVRGAADLPRVLAEAPKHLTLSLGVIDGRNVWRADLDGLLSQIAPIVAAWGAEKLILAPSCSLLHVPIDVTQERDLDADLRSWLAFAVQKLDELAVLRCALTEGRDAVAADLAAASAAYAARKNSPRLHNPEVRARLGRVVPAWAQRYRPFADRRVLQQAKLKLPPFPTTTIGSFPQTEAVRKARSHASKGALSATEYEAFLKQETEQAIRWQEEIDLDVLVHGEFERNDMVQYFGEQLSGYAFTQAGWVQSYGSRYVRPPILYGDVARLKPMTVVWASYAQSLTDRPVKGMLTGPVTMLGWSFVRDDVPRETVCRQIALALRDEVSDLEAAGIGIIQIDEPAFREGLPLRRAEWEAYLTWATECFRLSASGVSDATQIHTHMCYSEFNDIIGAIAAMDADVISIETSRSKMELLDAFTGFQYPNDIGPGVYDIHSPRVPTKADMVALLDKARAHLPPDQLWVNPDCGLKTRRWEEVKPALEQMVAAAKSLRAG
uniref:5-methyltetrahydropteroyltriglutamate-- homocysteine S-methyltransferase n=1 Tax=Elstera litoralis TaxID=552518 RepID=UPI0018DE42D3|nr:5-methyltetrahydropteroyltriglutamate--homocysteine S-methyltransferase [Elstera litoralis]